MPARRNRTEKWRESLERIRDRNGPIEITLPRYLDAHANAGQRGWSKADAQELTKNVIWRVRVLGLDDQSLVVEQPVALGHPIQLATGIALVGLIVVGQNRWIFQTRTLGKVDYQTNARLKTSAYRLLMPETVERCQRRNFYRVPTVNLCLPNIRCYHLLDLESAEMVETANRVEICDMHDRNIAGKIPEDGRQPVLPNVGPYCDGKLVNLGGGGVGLHVEPQERTCLEAARLLWLSIDLRPDIPCPLGVVARVRHTHVESNQSLYAGLSFEFGHNPRHEDFVADQLCRYVATLQREQLQHIEQSKSVGGLSL